MTISPILKNFILYCRVEVIGNEESMNKYLNDIKNYPNQEYYLGLKSKLKEILDDSGFDYLHLLFNNEYEFGGFPVDAEQPETQLEAKKLIIDYIWNKLYPDDRIEI